jgi:hypothetical protein
MITEIVLFSLPDGMSREDAMAKYRVRVPMWQASPTCAESRVAINEINGLAEKSALQIFSEGYRGCFCRTNRSSRSVADPRIMFAT